MAGRPYMAVLCLLCELETSWQVAADATAAEPGVSEDAADSSARPLPSESDVRVVRTSGACEPVTPSLSSQLEPVTGSNPK